MQASSQVHTHALERSDYLQASPRSAGKELRSHQLRRPLSRQESSRFCPRVFCYFRHFSQKSALKWPKFRALLWAYVRPERAQGLQATSAYIHALERSDYLR